MAKKTTSNLDTWLAILLLLATLAVIILQIVFSGPDSTKLETALFSVMQFIFSLAFSWLLAKVSLRREFQESQKSFAISAYRRITEINIGVERLLRRTNSQKQTLDDVTKHELDVLQEIGIGIKESIKSSIADWADIIGDEIEIIERIQNLREKLGSQSSLLIPTEEFFDDHQERTEDQIKKLKSNLPKALQLTADEIRDSSEEGREFAFKALKQEYKENGYIQLEGSYEIGKFDEDVLNMKEGDKVQLSIGDGKGRTGALIAYNSKNQSIGVIINRFAAVSPSYIEGIYYIIRFFGKSHLSGEIIEIKREHKTKGYHDFFVRVLEKPDIKVERYKKKVKSISKKIT